MESSADLYSTLVSLEKVTPVELRIARMQHLLTATRAMHETRSEYHGYDAETRALGDLLPIIEGVIEDTRIENLV